MKSLNKIDTQKLFHSFEYSWPSIECPSGVNVFEYKSQIYKAVPGVLGGVIIW